jgi:predicted nucleotidyltransferase component of viral defense system
VSGRDLGASVRQRLLNQSRAQNRPFQELLQYFVMERFLYRLAESPHADRFILKGALLLTAWRAPLSRPTMDIDLAGRIDNRLHHIKTIVSAVCSVVVDSDGIEFNRDSISRIKEDADYEGVRVQFHATLAKAQIAMQLDIGFGDVITPGPAEVVYPTLLDFPASVLRAYPRETVVAERLEAITVLGLLNSRMKDYYDLALLSRMTRSMESFWYRRSWRRFGTGGRQLKPNRSASRERIGRTPRVFHSGAHSYGAADLKKRRMTSCASWTKSGRSSCLSCPKSQTPNHSTLNGNRVDRGNETTSYPNVSETK